MSSEDGVRRAMEPPALRIETRTEGDSIFIVLAGELDASSCPAVEAKLADADGDGDGLVVVDLREVNFIDSTGIALLVRAMRASAEDSDRLRVVPSRSRDVQRLLEICGMDQALPILEDPAGDEELR